MSKSKCIFFVGPGKTGSSWLYENIKSHPDIKLPKNLKESNYFNAFKNPNKSEYLDLFFNYGNKSAINFDISNTYIYGGYKIAKKIKTNFPDSKIIIGYREPKERIISAYLFKKRNGEIPQSLSILECLENDKYGLIDTNKYYNLSKPYIELFEMRNIFIFDFNQISKNPKKILTELLNFIEIPIKIEKNKIHKKINPASQFRIKKLSKYSLKVSNFLRKNKLSFLLTFIKTNPIIQNLLFKKISNKSKINTLRKLIHEPLEKEGVFIDEIKFKKIFKI